MRQTKNSDDGKHDASQDTGCAAYRERRCDTNLWVLGRGHNTAEQASDDGHPGLVIRTADRMRHHAKKAHGCADNDCSTQEQHGRDWVALAQTS